MTPSISEKVFRIIKRIPAGRVATYKTIARLTGRPKAFRAIGQILHNNPHPVIVPCHRIINANGALGGYAGGLKKKIALLKKEGVKIEKERIDLKKFGWVG